MTEWIEEVEEGVILSVWVTPNAKRNEIIGYDSGRNALNVRIKALARDGKANRELVKFLKEVFRRDVKILSGERSRFKKVLIVGCSRMEVEENVG